MRREGNARGIEFAIAVSPERAIQRADFNKTLPKHVVRNLPNSPVAKTMAIRCRERKSTRSDADVGR